MMMSSFAETLRRIRFEKGMSQEEFANLLGTSKQNVSRYEKGEVSPKISTATAIARKLHITLEELNGAEADSLGNIGSLRRIGEMQMQRVPLIGSVAAGQPIMAEESWDTYIDAPSKADYALKVEGDSMVPTFQNGDIIYIRMQPDVEDGQIGVVLMDDCACVKHVYHTKHGLQLISDNPSYAPINVFPGEYGVVRVLGKVCGFTRMFR